LLLNLIHVALRLDECDSIEKAEGSGPLIELRSIDIPNMPTAMGGGCVKLIYSSEQGLAPDGVMVPRMFSELPVCVAAFKARKALADDAR
jgi:hypothetical protein